MSTVYCLHTCWHIISIVLYEQQTTLFVSSSCMCVQSALCQTMYVPVVPDQIIEHRK
jgi:hypothetical protein